MAIDIIKVKRNVNMTFWERIYIPEILRGISITSRHFFINLVGFIPAILFGKKRKIFTVYYPEEKLKYPDAYRGRPILVIGDDGVEKCVACGLCERMCPAFCISIQPAETELDKERYPETFTIDQSRCIVCGFCEEVCPKEAILMSQDIEIADYDRSKMLYQKEDLLIPEKDLRTRQAYVREAFARWNY